MPPKPGKKPSPRPNVGQSIPSQSAPSAQNVNKDIEPAQSEEEDIILDTAPASTQESANAHAQQNQNKCQTKENNKTSEVTLESIKNRLSVNIAKLNLVETVIDTLPSGLEGPLLTIAEQVKQLSACMSVTNQEVLHLCDIKNKQIEAPPPPSSYSDALKRTGETVASIQRSIRDDQRHNVFEKDRAKAARSFLSRN